MSRFGIFFAGREIVLPGVYGQVNADAMTPERGTTSRAVAILATSAGGYVGRPTLISNPNQITKKAVGGVAARLAEVVFGASGELPGAAEVYVLRVNKAVPSTLSLGDGVLSANQAGRIGDAIRVRRVAGVPATAPDVGLDVGTDLYLEHTQLPFEPESYKGLGPVLELVYVGSATTPTVAVATSGGVTTLTLTGTATVALTSTATTTLYAVVDAVNQTAEWTARLVGPLVGARLEDVVPKTYTLTASKKTRLSLGGKALAAALENSQIATFAPGSDAPTTTGAWTYLSGGSEGTTPVTQDWLDALALLADLDIHGLVVGTGDPYVIAAAAAVINSRSDAKNRKESLLYCGVDRSTSKSNLFLSLKALAQGASGISGIGGPRVVIAAAEPKLLNADTNKIEVYPSYYVAAMAAGLKAGNRPEMPLTNKSLSILGTSYVLETEELEDLIENGLMPVAYEPTVGKFVIVQGITSYTRDANVIYRKIAGMDIADYLNQKIRSRLARYIGEVGDQLTINSILFSVKRALAEEVRSPVNLTGVLTGGINPATGEVEDGFKNIEVIMDGFDLVGVRYEAHPVGEIAYIFGTAYLTPVKIIAQG